MDIEAIRNKFPILKREIDGKCIIYFDNACQTLRPREVVEAVSWYHEEIPACAGRSIHKLASKVSIEIDRARERIAKFVNARQVEEISFTRNCTEAINTVLFGIGLQKGDKVIATDREHNSVHVPLLKLRDLIGIRYEYVPSADDETFDLEQFKEMMNNEVRLVSMCHTSNVNGTTLPAREICEIAHDYDARVLLDGAQYVPYGGADLEKIGSDFYAFSSHKMCGPSGIGVLHGRIDMLEKLRPLTYGGHGVSGSTREKADLLPPPERFEAGLQNYAGMIGAGVAADYIRAIGRDEIISHVIDLNRAASEGIADLASVDIIRPHNATLRGSILSFNLKGYSSHDIAMILDHLENIMIRSGMHCVHSWFNDRKIDGSARASFYIYNTRSEVEKFIETLAKIDRDAGRR